MTMSIIDDIKKKLEEKEGDLSLQELGEICVKMKNTKDKLERILKEIKTRIRKKARSVGPGEDRKVRCKLSTDEDLLVNFVRDKVYLNSMTEDKCEEFIEEVGEETVGELFKREINFKKENNFRDKIEDLPTEKRDALESWLVRDALESWLVRKESTPRVMTNNTADD